MSKCKKVNISNKARMELHDALSLTGAEISINTLPAGECVPFVHCHKNNEEIYGIISGSGKVIIDGDEVQLIAGEKLHLHKNVNSLQVSMNLSLLFVYKSRKTL